ncbi:NEL-type E3 ubiquitin ligase domain-containing protein [Mycoavidus sp. B2-EB]|uniref:NEL-type E3 ubiquitin ligase domain-containing protein n=1 Tax=Mycoavidus sp. B2-EB TaxID=2651972 RepID=UPI0016231FFB|nr:NEL-type E3 ubiquitin ligase domain-containing protein [Mycoavidus sp. B2-EB]BBO59913.1 hypothetical protein MPB2EB_1043 [Mycoavidus sp. B2-EB]
MIKLLEIYPAKENQSFENWATHITTANASTFSNFLLRLFDTADAKSSVGLERLKQRLRRVLLELVAHEDLNSLCFYLANEALETCGNRVSLGLNHIEQVFLNAKVKRDKISQNEMADIVMQQFRLNKLETVICEKFKHLPSSTQVETYLAVQINLRDLWGSLIQEQDMLYPRLSGISAPEMGEIRQLLERVGRGAELLNFFTHHEAWRSYLEREYFEEFESYKIEYKRLLEAWAKKPADMTQEQYDEGIVKVKVQLDEKLRDMYINFTKQEGIALGIPF